MSQSSRYFGVACVSVIVLSFAWNGCATAPSGLGATHGSGDAGTHAEGGDAVAADGPPVACDPADPQPGCQCVGDFDCYTGPKSTAGVGLCKAGLGKCVKGILGNCTGEILPAAEICDGLDNDCNGVVDDVALDAGVIGTYADASFTCITGLRGICLYGNTVCEGDAGLVCVGIAPEGGVSEICNGVDDDCNGIVDDIPALPCSVPGKKGECAKGIDSCPGAGDAGVGDVGPLSSDGSYCRQVNMPVTEICNGKDDNCNGLIDDGPVCGSGYYCAGVSGCQLICPYVFSFDGKTFEYETSVGGMSLIGRKEHLIKGKDIDFQTMLLRLDHASIETKNGLGRVRAKIAAAEDEIVYVDEARLAVVEHDVGYEVFSSSTIEWNTLHRADPKELFGLRTSAMRLPLAASWMANTDVKALLSSYEERAAPFDTKIDNFYELDFGDVRDGSHARLVIEGWKNKILRNLPASIPERQPHLEVQRADGTWRSVLEIATPRGDKKAVVFDLSSIEWPSHRYRFRLYTGTHEGGNAMWYLDRVRLTEEPVTPLVARVYDASRAELSFTGPPSVFDPTDYAHPVIATDDGKGELLPAQRTWGRFTKYGDVRALLSAPDDQLVVMRRGDSIELTFEGLTLAKPGRLLSVFVQTQLLFKPRTWLGEAEPTEITKGVEPLPFHGMSHYPPATPFPSDALHSGYLEAWNTREYKPGDPRWGR